MSTEPNDLDQYEGRYGVENTKMALREAHKKGLQTFCVTIDERAEHYLPHIFGSHGYVILDTRRGQPVGCGELTNRIISRAMRFTSSPHPTRASKKLCFV